MEWCVDDGRGLPGEVLIELVGRGAPEREADRVRRRRPPTVAGHGWTRSLHSSARIQSESAEVLHCRNLNGGSNRSRWPVQRILAGGFGSGPGVGLDESDGCCGVFTRHQKVKVDGPDPATTGHPSICPIAVFRASTQPKLGCAPANDISYAGLIQNASISQRTSGCTPDFT